MTSNTPDPADPDVVDWAFCDPATRLLKHPHLIFPGLDSCLHELLQIVGAKGGLWPLLPDWRTWENWTLNAVVADFERWTLPKYGVDCLDGDWSGATRNDFAVAGDVLVVDAAIPLTTRRLLADAYREVDDRRKLEALNRLVPLLRWLITPCHTQVTSFCVFIASGDCRHWIDEAASAFELMSVPHYVLPWSHGRFWWPVPFAAERRVEKLREAEVRLRHRDEAI